MYLDVHPIYLNLLGFHNTRVPSKELPSYPWAEVTLVELHNHAHNDITYAKLERSFFGGNVQKC